MKSLLILSLFAAATPSLAADFGHWAGRVKEAMEGNYDCYPVTCQDSDPALDSVNCKNMNSVDFSFSRFANGKAPGYLWISYSPDGPTADDAALERNFTIDGDFDIHGFTNTGIFKDPTMGSSHYVNLKSMSIVMGGTAGEKAVMTIDFGGKAPLRSELRCCTPGDECNGTPDQVGPPIFQNPPVLCPSFPKEARDECLGRNR